jgi:hypothetical protein
VEAGARDLCSENAGVLRCLNEEIELVGIAVGVDGPEVAVGVLQARRREPLIEAK